VHCIEERMYDIQRGAWVACERCSGGLRLPQSRVPSTVAQRVIHFGPEPWQVGSGSFALRGERGSRKLAVALLGAHTPSKKSAANFRDASIHRLSEEPCARSYVPETNAGE